MNANAISFSSEIERVAANLGRAPTPDQISNLNLVLQSLAEIDLEAGTVSIEGEAVDAYLNREAAKFAPVEAPSTPKTSGYVRFEIGNSASYRRADDALVKITNSFRAAEDAALAREAAEWPNPWAAGHENRTRQSILTNTEPARAAKLKAEAKK